MKTQITSRVMHIAHTLMSDEQKIILPMSKQTVSSWSDCMKMAWYFMRLKRALSDGVVQFSFRKSDGSVREARGTLNGTLIPREDAPKDEQGNRTPVWSAIAFYDIDKKAWRSFRISSFIGFVSAYKLVTNNFNKETR